MGSTSTASLCGLHCHNVDGLFGCCCGCAACFPTSFEWKGELVGPLCRKTFPRQSIHTEISPLRYASVEMTKGREVVARRASFQQLLSLEALSLSFVISTEAQRSGEAL